MRRVEITLEGEEADVVEASLRPEAAQAVPKATVAMERLGESLLIAIEADDTAALRAALNSYLRWASVASRVRDVVDRG